MRPELLLDVEAGTARAALCTPEGELLPLELERAGRSMRELSLGLVLDAAIPPEQAFSLADLAALAGATPRVLLAKLRERGLMRPWELPARSLARRLTFPLALLAARSSCSETPPHARAAAFAVLDALLDPLFVVLREKGLSARGLDVTLLLGPGLGPRGASALALLLRRRGVRRLQSLDRSLAGTFAFLRETSHESGISERVVGVELAEEHLHLSWLEIEGDERRIEVRCPRAFTVRDRGRRWLAGRLAAELGERVWAERDSALQSAFERALQTLLEGGAVDEPFGEPPGRLTLSLLEGLLTGSLGEELRAEIRQRCGAGLEGLLETLSGVAGGSTLDGDRGAVALLGLGSGFALARLADVFAGALGLVSEPGLERIPARERALEGVAALRRWLAASPGRRAVARIDGGLRLDTLRGGSLEILPPASFSEQAASAGRWRQVVTVHGDLPTELPLTWHWGVDADPLGGTPLGALVLPRAIDADGESRRVALDLRLARHRDGLGWSGSARLAAEKTRRLRLAFRQGLSWGSRC